MWLIFLQDDVIVRHLVTRILLRNTEIQISTCAIFFLGLGRTAPDPNATVTLDGVQVPLGKGVNTNIDDTSLLYNEYPLNKALFILISCIITLQKLIGGFSHLPVLVLSPLLLFFFLTTSPPGISCMTLPK